MDNRTDFPSGTPGLRLGCVIMASGMGTRFGGNKLMADFGGAPMIARILQATDGLFARRVVVTRHADVAAFCLDAPQLAGVPDGNGLLVDLPADGLPVRVVAGRGQHDHRLLCPGGVGAGRQNVPQPPVWLGVQLIDEDG